MGDAYLRSNEKENKQQKSRVVETLLFCCWKISLRGDHGAGLSTVGIEGLVDGSDDCRTLFAAADEVDGCLDFREHFIDAELVIGDMGTCLFSGDLL